MTTRNCCHYWTRSRSAATDPAVPARRITDADIDVLVATAKTLPARLGLPFTHWSIRKLTGYLDGDYGHRNPTWVPAHAIRIGRERVRRILHDHDISFQRTRTWKTSTDPAYDTKLDRMLTVADLADDAVGICR